MGGCASGAGDSPARTQEHGPTVRCNPAPTGNATPTQHHTAASRPAPCRTRGDGGRRRRRAPTRAPTAEAAALALAETSGVEWIETICPIAARPTDRDEPLVFEALGSWGCPHAVVEQPRPEQAFAADVMILRCEAFLDPRESRLRMLRAIAKRAAFLQARVRPAVVVIVLACAAGEVRADGAKVHVGQRAWHDGEPIVDLSRLLRLDGDRIVW